MATESADCAVLGIDAAWTAANPSGVALVVRRGGRARVERLASSFSAFVENPQRSALVGRTASLDDVIRTARRDTDVPLACVAMDVPLSRRAIRGRRAADRAISRAFGAMKCAAHSPNPNRPGAWGRALQRAAETAGYTLQCAGDPPGLPRAKALIEVYPHPALLRLCSMKERLPYKSKFPEALRRRSITRIWNALVTEMDGVPVDLVVPPESATGREWKACEDALDALVCAWVGLEFLAQRAIPYGDSTAAVWVPSASRETATPSQQP